MSDSLEQNSELERIHCAIGTATLDRKLLDQLVKAGYDEDEILKMVSGFLGGFEEGHITCATVRNELRRSFPLKRGKQTRDLVLRYRKQMQNWVNQATPYPHPPTLEVQQLPAPRSETLKRYFNLFERLHKRRVSHQAPNANADVSEVLQERGMYEALRHSFESNEPGLVRRVEIENPLENVTSILEDYINRSEENALEVLVYILSLNDNDVTIQYHPLISAAINRLSGNIHFIRTLFNLYDENAYREKPVNRVTDACNTLILAALRGANVIQEWDGENDLVGNEEPRDFWYQQHTHDMRHSDGSVTTTELLMKVPASYLPLHWNGTRLVNPLNNSSYGEFAGLLEEDADRGREGKIEEMVRYVDEIEGNRRYGLDFSRVKVIDIPGTEDMDIWFNYYHDEDMEPEEVQIEVMVNDASIIYHINHDRCYMASQNNVVPRLPNPGSNPDHLDELYGRPDVQQWASEEAQENLKYYLLKYLHALLVLPRSVGRSSEGSRGERENAFNLRLRGHSTETYIPSDGEGGQRRITIHHYNTAFSTVTGHIRRLPPGHRASSDALAEAEKHSIHLVPGQTFVKEHTRGSELTEQGRSGKGHNLS